MKTNNQSKVTIIGVGGAGCNTVEFLHTQPTKHVQLVICDADACIASEDQALLCYSISDSESLKTLENTKATVLLKQEALKEMLLKDSPEIVFIVAGMGGITGTAAAPEIARIAKEKGLLTIGVVTTPLSLEGENKIKKAAEGIAAMRVNTNTTLVLSSDKFCEIYKELPAKEAFAKANEYIANAIRAIAEIVTVTAEVNVDVDDVRTVLEDAGTAIVGTAVTAGEGRAMLAAQLATDFSFLSTKTDMAGARRVLLSITSGVTAELEMEELVEITQYIQDIAGEQAEVIFGHAIDDELQDSIRVTLIAAGFSEN